MFHLERSTVVAVEKPREVQVALLSWGHVEMVGWPTGAFGEAAGRVGAHHGFNGCLASPTRSFSLGAAFCFRFLTVCSLFSPDPPQSSTL